MEDLTALVLPEGEESDTLGGLLTERLGRLPDVDDAVDIEARDERSLDPDGMAHPVRVRLAVTRLDGRRVDRIRLTRLPAEERAGNE